MKPLLVALMVAFLANSAMAQDRFLIADRTGTGQLYWMEDTNTNGVIDLPDEGHSWFNAANANVPPTIALSNPNAMGISRTGLVVVGDQGNRVIYFMRDLNKDGDGNDLGESAVVATSPSAVPNQEFGFPTGVAFDSRGNVYISNAGNANTPDQIWRIPIITHGAALESAGTPTLYVYNGPGGFGGGNSTVWSPQEIIMGFEGDDTMYLRNSISNFFGFFKIRDANNSGRADDTGEVTPWWTLAVSGFTPATGFPIEWDRLRPNAIFTMQTATGAVDQLIRVTDANTDGDGNDANEAALVYSTAETGFTNIDLVTLHNGDVMITDNSGKRVVRLRDSSGNGAYESDERTTFFTAPAGDVRAINILPPFTACTGDMNADGVVNGDDLPRFIATLLNPQGARADAFMTADMTCGGIVDGQDIQPMVNRLLGF